MKIALPLHLPIIITKKKKKMNLKFKKKIKHYNMKDKFFF